MATVSIANTDAGLSGKTVSLLESDQTMTGLKTFSRGAQSPFAVAVGSTKVTNLDADLLDGQDGSYYTNATNLASGTVPIARLGTGGSATTFLRGDQTYVAPTWGMMFFLSFSGIAAGVTTFLGTSTASVTETDCKWPIPFACTIKNMYALADGTPGGSETFIYTLRKTSVDQTVTCTTSAAGLTSNDTTHSASFAAGDFLSVKLVVSAGASTRKHFIAFQIT